MSSTHTREYHQMLRRLKEARKAAGLTQAAIAEALGVTVSTASKIERGERRLDPVELWRLAKLYGKPVSAFLPK